MIFKKLILLLVSINLIHTFCNSQNTFTERLTMYYDVNVPKTDSLYNVILSDTVISRQGTYKDFMDFIVPNNLLYKDTMVSVCIITKMRGDSFRNSIGLSNEYKTKILVFISDVLLYKHINNYLNILPDCLFDYNFWEYGNDINDSIQYNATLKNNLKQIIQNKTNYLVPSAIRLFDECHLQELFPYVIKYAVKPYFEDTAYKQRAIDSVWGYIYFLAKANDNDVLPYLYKAISKFECPDIYSMEKYGNASELAFITKDNHVKKNIYLNLLKNAYCMQKMVVPTILRNDPRKTYFETIILDRLKIQYKNFPIEKVQRLSNKAQVEFVRNWIEKNM